MRSRVSFRHLESQRKRKVWDYAGPCQAHGFQLKIEDQIKEGSELWSDGGTSVRAKGQCFGGKKTRLRFGVSLMCVFATPPQEPQIKSRQVLSAQSEDAQNRRN